MTSRRERRNLARETKRDRKRAVKAEIRRQRDEYDRRLRSARERLAARPDSDTEETRDR